MQASPPEIRSIHLGTARPFARARASAIDKRPTRAPVLVGALGILGDEQADNRVHGGPDRALSHYPAEHYADWRVELPDVEGWAPGAFGENLSSLGLTEAEVCIGDRWRLGRVLLEVSQPRSPCWKIEVRLGVDDLAERVRRSARSGWLYRVIETGELSAGTAMELVARPCPEWSLRRLWQLRVAPQTEDAAALRRAARLAPLAESWRGRYHALSERRESV